MNVFVCVCICICLYLHLCVYAWWVWDWESCDISWCNVTLLTIQSAWKSANININTLPWCFLICTIELITYLKSWKKQKVPPVSSFLQGGRKLKREIKIVSQEMALICSKSINEHDSIFDFYKKQILWNYLLQGALRTVLSRSALLEILLCQPWWWERYWW